MKQLDPLLFILFSVLPFLTHGQNFDAKLIELYFANDSEPQNFIEAESGFYFTAKDPVYGRELWFSNGSIDNTYMVRDIAEGDSDSYLQTWAVLGDLLFFSATPDVRLDRDLWISDGSPEGTLKIKDVSVGEMITYKGKVYFQGVSEEEEGAELWESDGTTEGTKILKKISTGPYGSAPSKFFEFNDLLFFMADDGNSGQELWKTDGTSEGTLMVKNINPSHGSLYSSTRFMTFGDNFYFMANDGENGQELFKSDGTEEGTGIVKNINPNGHSMMGLQGTVTQNAMYFVANDGVNGFELWKSDGTDEGTRMVKNIHPNWDAFNTHNINIVALGNTVFFVADDGINGNELWKTDGTEEGTHLVKNIGEGSNSSGVKYLKQFKDKIYFVAAAPNQDFNLWTSDGTASGTYPLSEVKMTTNLSSLIFEFFEFEDRLYFVADSEIYGRELWVSDGTAEGTNLFKDFNHQMGSMPRNFNEINGVLFFSARKVTYGNQLFISNGTIEGTRMVKNINLSGYNAIDEESEFIVMNDELFFSAHDGVHGFELWKSDGTEGGTEMVKDIRVGTKSSLLNEKFYSTFAVIDDKLFFMANDGVHGYELWISDGTEEGTNLVKDIFPGAYNGSPSNVVSLNNTIYFRAHDQTGSAIWKTDGTGSGTVKIKNLHDIRNMRVINNKLIIVAETSGTTYGPHDLWVSDGTAEGTSHLKSFGDGHDSSIEYLEILNDELYFVAKNPETLKKSVYKTNGTLEGTELLYEGTVDIDILRICGNYVYFVAEKENSYGGVELWRTNGSKENTVRVAGTAEGAYNFYESLTCFQNEMYFIDAYNNQEIWRVDKTSGETNQLSYTVDGEVPSEDLIMSSLTGTRNVLYFVGSTPESGGELYAIQNGELASLPVDEIPEENISTNIFTLKTYNETCEGKNNGVLSIESNEEHQFTAVINGTTYNFAEDLEVEDLAPGDYSVCIKKDSIPDFEQCFEFTIQAGVNMEGRMQSRKIPEGTLINVNIDKGTAPFNATIDGEIIASSYSHNFSVLASKKGKLEISSSKACEGKLSVEIDSKRAIVAYPNPASSYLNIAISDIDLKEIGLIIYNGSGQRILTDVVKIKNNVIKIDVQNYKPGLYYAVLQLETLHTIKFFKK